MSKIMRKFSVAVAFLLGMTVCAVSQARAQTNRYSVFGGYSYGTNNFFNREFGGAASGLHGYGAAFTVNLNNHIGLEATFTGHNGTSTIYDQIAGPNNYGERDTSGQSLYAYTFGPRLFQNVGKFSLFTHFLVGGVHLHQNETYSCTLPSNGGNCFSPNPELFYQHGNGFAFKTGGGVDWNHGRWGVRILEVDYVRGQMLSATTTNYTAPFSETSSANNFELATGITFNFGSLL